MRVSVQLIDARNDTHLWAEHYDRDVADVFAIQTEVAQQIADQLQAKLSPAEKAAIAERPTGDPVAYALYTEAKAIGDHYDWEGEEKPLNREVELLEKATQRDPNFALAYCALAKTQVELSFATEDPEDRKHLELAKKAAEAASRVRPDLGRLIWNWLAITTTRTFTPVISTEHVTNWLSLAARCRIILKRS